MAEPALSRRIYPGRPLKELTFCTALREVRQEWGILLTGPSAFTQRRYMAPKFRVQYPGPVLSWHVHTFAAILLLAAAALSRGADLAGQAMAPDKFIPTFAVKYGGSTGWPDLREAARFDLIVAGAGT